MLLESILQKPDHSAKIGRTPADPCLVIELWRSSIRLFSPACLEQEGETRPSGARRAPVRGLEDEKTDHQADEGVGILDIGVGLSWNRILRKLTYQRRFGEHGFKTGTYTARIEGVGGTELCLPPRHNCIEAM